MTPFITPLIFILFLMLATPGQGRSEPLVISPDMQYDYAVKLLTDKDFSTATVEFKRFLHFFPDSEKADHARFLLGACLVETQNFYEAARVFNDIILADKPGPVTREAYFYQSRAFEQMGNFGYAQIVLQNYLKLAADPDTKDRIHYQLGRLFLSMAAQGKDNALENAKNAFKAISLSGTVTYEVDHHLSLIQKAEQAPQKDPVLAGILSLIPGGGFAYCGRYKDALTTLLFNAGLIAGAFKAWDDDNKALAGVAGFVEAGFYTGNIYGSISAAHKRNKAQTVKILDQTLTLEPSLNQDEYKLMFKLDF